LQWNEGKGWVKGLASKGLLKPVDLAGGQLGAGKGAQAGTAQAQQTGWIRVFLEQDKGEKLAPARGRNLSTVLYCHLLT
jgi:hypothetical protein